MTVEQDIARTLARLNMWRDVASEEEVKKQADVAHAHINELLDLWREQRCAQPETVESI